MEKSITEIIRRHKIVAILRGVEKNKMETVIDALYVGGIRILEITFNHGADDNSTDTIHAINYARQRYGDTITVGAGTVLTSNECNNAVSAGAEFILSPNVDIDVISNAGKNNIDVIPGALTPTEIVKAYQMGAKVVKLFPAGDMGISYAGAVMAPLGHIPLLAVGGINLDNINEYLRAGFVGVGLGASLTRKEYIDTDAYEELSNLVRKYISKVKEAEQCSIQ